VADIFKLFNDAVFGPEELQIMGSVFDLVKTEMPQVDPYLIAASILRHAKNGTLQEPMLATETINELRAPQRR
jgi:hypothetical protein